MIGRASRGLSVAGKIPKILYTRHSCLYGNGPLRAWKFQASEKACASLASLFPKRKQERNHAQRDQYCRDGEPRCGNFGARMKILFESRSHADEKEQKRKVDQNYADRFAGVG